MPSLTYAPLPDWKSLAKAVFAVTTDAKLAAPWLHNNEKYYWFSRSAWSLYVITLLRIRVTRNQNIRVWMPAFFCNASLAPLRNMWVKLQFYPLMPDGKPDMNICEQMLESGSPDLIVFAHYFGEPFDSKDLSLFSKKNNAWLVEDCAHCLKPENGIGVTGDFVLYSPHKFLALPDGALLLIRNDGPSNLMSVEFEDLYHSLFIKVRSSFIANLKWLLKRILQKLRFRSNLGNAKFHNNDTEMDLAWLPHPKMSCLAKRLLKTMISSLEIEAKNRKRNALQWKTDLINNPCPNMCIKPSSGNFTPYMAVFQTETEKQAEKIFYSLQNANVPVTTWPDLPPEVLHDITEQKTSIKRRFTRFYLPVHSSIEPKKITEILRCIR